ncbi:ammonium transporter [Pseudonocardia acidicola]|uniref:Ammonium transporter n=1 Tax=Pseudonocardia acidicola TaxID=2724939 RepID=A0ABX1SCD0_9PSEU|nr:ammonium transporter [Pseudonocardia acidicola]NMH99216.1 ammonium transporter [Pseudonocardia acidicola]
MVPYPDWLNAGDNAWQLVAATLVGLMSIPGIAVLYGGIVQRKWAVNTMIMAFTGFSLVLLVWVLWVFKMGFGEPLKLGPGILAGVVGKPGPILGSGTQQQAVIPLLDGQMPAFRFPQSTLAYFQFVFAGITPLLFLGSVVGRINFKVWLIFVPLWSTLAYSVNAFLLWGGGWWAQQGSLDYSGGYVIHLAAGTSGFVAAAVIGPRLARDRARAVPNNLPMAAAGAGLLWLGWNGFNGGDPYFAGADAATAVLNTNLATATAVLAWVVLDMLFGVDHKPTFLGGINGMITGLVAITPAAGYVNGLGALLIGLIASSLVWLSWNKLSTVRPFSKVDDALGVVYTHGVAGLCGGLLVGFLADPHIIVYLGRNGTPDVSYTGLLYGNPKQLLVQAGAALTIIVWDALITFLILRFLGLFMKLRLPDPVLEVGDVGVHDEEAYPQDTLIGASVGSGSGIQPAPPVAAAVAEPRKTPT